LTCVTNVIPIGLFPGLDDNNVSTTNDGMYLYRFVTVVIAYKNKIYCYGGDMTVKKLHY